MSNRPFVHLHNHTEYSLLDGATRIKDMVALAKEQEMPAMAITDHGVMFGAMEFYFACKSAGIKPIIGMEAYVSPQGIDYKSGREEKSSYHLLLLAKNEEGYRNLCRLHSIAALDGFYYKPRIDHEILREHSAGLISSTTCLGSEVNQALLRGNYEEAREIAAMYRDIFEEDSFFVELQDHGIAEQQTANQGLVKIAKDLNLPLVTTNDIHYLCKEDTEPHDVLLCIGTGKLLKDQDRMKYVPEFYVKSRDEMAAIFPDHPEAIENTLMIAEKCDLNLQSERALMPEPEMPEGETPATYLRKLAEEGLKDRILKLDDQAWERLNYELDVIKTTEFDSYFLLVREFAQFTRKQGIQFGVRGSAAGSLVSYCLGITDVDPLEYGLTFERFLNPERVTMPDVDMDFEDARRDEIIRWVGEKYGKDRVAQIVTFGTLGAKAAIRDAARVMDFPPAEADQVAKAIPNGPGWSISKAEDPKTGETGEFRRLIAENDRFRKLVETAKRIEGISRHCGVHAAGVVISNEPLRDLVPLYRGNDGQAVTAYEMGILEQIGLLKMDFLGLSNLTVVARTIDNVRAGLPKDALLSEHPVLEHGIHGVPLDDQKAYDLLSRGDTVGVFQLESAGMRRNIVELKPRSVRELAAMVALYRPGPMAEIPKFIEYKHGRSKPSYLHPLMEPILEETYGIIVYQDQVMGLVRALAGFTLGKADVLRRAMGKKKKAEMDKMMPEYFAGCEANGVTRETAQKVWDLLQPFADYAFNKAHAVCYAILAYQTAYLKANYPVEYMAALLGVYRTKEDRIIACIEECRRMGIRVVPPDINRSNADFTVEIDEKGNKSIRFGLAAIKGVGDGLIGRLIEERAENGEFTHPYEFAERIRPHGLNKLAMESMIKAGALDGLGPNRRVLLETMDGALGFADQRYRDFQSGQDSLFGGDDDAEAISYPQMPAREPYDRHETLAMEKDVMGIYVSDHPLRGYEMAVRQHASVRCSQVPDLANGERVTLAGVLTKVRKAVSKAGKSFAELVIEDFSGQTRCMVFEKAYDKNYAFLEKDRAVKISGTVSHRERMGAQEPEIEVRVFSIDGLPEPSPNDLIRDETLEGRVFLKLRRATKVQLQKVRTIIEENPGDYEIAVQFAELPDAPPMVLLTRFDAKKELLTKIRHTLEECDVDVISYSSMNGHSAPAGDSQRVAGR